MPDELRDLLTERARTGGRSLHAEIIGILQEAVGDRPQLAGVDIDSLADAIAARVATKLKGSQAE